MIAVANSTHSVLNPCGAAQIAQVRTDRAEQSVLTFAQVKTGKTLNSTDSTDISLLVSRESFVRVVPVRLSPDALCGAHMQKSVLSVLTPRAANAAPPPAQRWPVEAQRPGGATP
ncbi:hypothetical protein SEA_NERGAL_61 [Mycobacterium Phage Nergal]|nr:hypothetical protein SEA_NERGAL_61 [Mycobacterium Phage Nergal]